MAERRDKHETRARARDRNIEAAFSTFLENRSKAVRQALVGVLVVANAEYDGVALIALDALDVLDEKALLIRFGEELVERRIVYLAETTVERIFDVVSMMLTKGDNAERFVWILMGVFQDEFDNLLSLIGVRARPK